jgi:hypothetical protein
MLDAREKLEWKRPFEKSKRRWKGNIKLDLKEVCEDVCCIHVAQQRVLWRALVNGTFRFHERRGISLPCKRLSRYEEVCSMKFSWLWGRA